MELMYNEKEQCFYQSKKVLIERIVDVLVTIFKKTLKTNEIFNVELLIRQNFLTICETPEYCCEVFGNEYVRYYDSFCEDYLSVGNLESIVIDRVMMELKLIDLDIKDVI